MSIDAALAQRDRGLAAPLRDLLGSAAQRVPAFARRMAEAGLSADAVHTVADLDALPVMDKDEVLARQHADPPFGGMLAADARVLRVFQSPGPLYEPQVADADWRWGQALTALGVGARDIVLNCFGYHLSPAGAMLEQGAHSVGAATVPGGIGAQDLQARAVADLGVTAYTGLPSYLKALIDRFDAEGFAPDRWRLSKALLTAEPLPDSLRTELQQRVAAVRMSYGTGETGLLAYEDGPEAGMVLAEDVLVQVCDLDTGQSVTDDRHGQVVVTVLRPDYPLVRFGTGDLSAWTVGSDGSLRLAGVLGRVGQAVKVRGMFLHPSQVREAMSGASGVADYRFVIGRAAHKDTLRCEIVADPALAAASQPGREQVCGQVAERVRARLRFRAEVVVVEQLTPGEGPLVDTRTWD